MEITDTPDLVELELQNEKKEVIEVIDDDQRVEDIVKALSSKTRRKILEYIREGPKDVSNIAKNLAMTEANISAQIKKLESSGLITCNYKSGLHGVRKISTLKSTRILIRF